MHSGQTSTLFAAGDYDLATTFDCGQAFRWKKREDGSWEGIVQSRWVRLFSRPHGIEAQTVVPVTDWAWLSHYLQADEDLARIVHTFPDDTPMQAAIDVCRGMRLLRQDRWECLASFILSATKQIVQIRQIIGLLCERFGEPVAVPPGVGPAHAFPTAERLAAATEAELRACKMGFRAPHLLAASRRVASGEVNLDILHTLSLVEARAALTGLRGVGDKIADCVLLFGVGFPQAFPVDVWIKRALKELYFPKRKPTPRRLREFADTHFGPHSGYAQQYLFHYMRRRGSPRADKSAP